MTELQESLPAPAAVEEPEAPRPDNNPVGAGSRIRSVIKHVLMIAASFVMIYPLLWLTVSSFRPTDVIFRTLVARREILRNERASTMRILGSRYSPEALALRAFATRARLPFRFIDLEDNDDVQAVSHNAELPESVSA